MDIFVNRYGFDGEFDETCIFRGGTVPCILDTVVQV